MRTLLLTIIAFFILTGCSSTSREEKDSCSKQAFTNIDSALKCGGGPKNYKSLLFILVDRDLERYQELGWNALKDEDIIKTAKRDYVLIVIDPTKVNLTSQDTPQEFIDIIKRQKATPYFVVTNRVLYPFREFDLSVDKEKIIDDLRIGEGP